MHLPKISFPSKKSGYTFIKFRPNVAASLVNINMPEPLSVHPVGTAASQEAELYTDWYSDPRTVLGAAGGLLVVFVLLCLVYDRFKPQRKPLESSTADPYCVCTEKDFVSQSDSWIYTDTFIEEIDGSFPSHESSEDQPHIQNVDVAKPTGEEIPDSRHGISGSAASC